ncbi:MAG TPA: hypothetical protein VFE05_16995 [Longimicrobiaceae bacterium]|jgi:hypothetical protein|nr:hypothetical protein [Longimicrobiaceae bacterium]
MPHGKMSSGTAKKTSAPIRPAGSARRVKKQGDWNWFDHPEMQARIAESETDICEGRTKKFDSPADALAYLNGCL